MKTSIIGYPRVGTLRELKFASEKFFRGEITEQDLQQTAATMRQTQWQLQKTKGLDYIPSNDFSFYDKTLDMAVLLNIIPERYQALGLSKLATYFAMARGYQGKKGDVKAFAMKKWFNTNYHYMVPEIDDTTKIFLHGTKPFDEYKEAKSLGILTKPVLIGPFTLLKLLKYTGARTAIDFVLPMIQAYQSILEQFQSLQATWIQFDEPYLVHDLTSDDIALFTQLYRALLTNKKDTKILLQTYFGDIRDCYQEVCDLGFDGIGLDFVEGKQSLSLVQTHGVPTHTTLFAGVVNGKNIWRNHYEKTLSTVQTLQQHCSNIVLSTSCSLQHVPYTLDNEKKLSDAYKKHFAYAQEKLVELQDLKQICESAVPYETAVFQQNNLLFTEARDCKNPEVLKRVEAISELDFVRLPAFHEREAIQKAKFTLPLFPTTTIGSFPQTPDVKANRTAFKKGNIDEATYTTFNHQKIAECVALQEAIGLDVLVHGEYERNDMVEYFGECLDGYLFTEYAWVQSYGTRCVKPPVVWGDISREKPISVAYSTYAQSLTNKVMKGMLTGPVTILNWSFPREDISLKECAYQIGLAIRDEVLDLEANGIRMIQVDEAALREKLPLRKSDWQEDYLDWAIPAFRLVHSKVKADTQIHTHMCYSEFNDIIQAIDDMDADVITFEASRSDLMILDALKDNNFKTQVGPGVYDIHSPRIPSVEEIKDALAQMLKKIDSKKLWINPDCGLKTRGSKETKPSLEHMVEAAIALREEYK